MTALLLTSCWRASGQNPELVINVIEGEGAINNTRTHTGHNPVVEVRDSSGTPLVGAIVTFQLPKAGAGGRFAGGETSLITQAGEYGQAISRSLRPNSVPGPFEIRVTASYQGRTASAIISQTNAAPAEAKINKKFVIIAVVVGAGAGGVFAANHSSKSSTASSASQAGIVAGSPSFGPPH